MINTALLFLGIFNGLNSSFLLQVILEVAPGTLYDELFVKVFRNSLFLLSSHQCGNFVVQALVSHARTRDQVCTLKRYILCIFISFS